MTGREQVIEETNKHHGHTAEEVSVEASLQASWSSLHIKASSSGWVTREDWQHLGIFPSKQAAVYMLGVAEDE